MKLSFKKVISVFLCIAVVFSAVCLPAAANDDAVVPVHTVVYDPSDPGYNEGHSHLTTAQIIEGIDKINVICEEFFGFRLFNGEKLRVKADGIMADIFRNWTESSNRNLDFDLILDSIPNIGYGADKITELFNLSPEVFNTALKEKAAELSAKGDRISSFLITYLRAYLLVIDEVTITAYPSENVPGIYDVKIVIRYRSGEEEAFDTDLIYNAVTKVFGTRGSGGIAGFNVDTNDYTVFAVTNPWQRNFGFCLFYDFMANATKLYDYDEKRVTFTYGGRDWLFEIWKGIYHQVGIGAEFAMYNRPEGITRTSFYNCAKDEDMLIMSLDLYQGSRLVFSRKPQLHWWLVGFCIEDRIYDAEYLTAKGTVDFPDEEMAELFVSAAKRTGVSARRDGTFVEWAW